MIGVVADELEHPAVAEFFELFKTRWEFHQLGRHYEVLLCSSDRIPENDAALVVVYGSRPHAFEQARCIRTNTASGPKQVTLRGQHIPIYKKCLLLERGTNELLFYREGGSIVPGVNSTKQQAVVRIGFDLFEEVRHLLTIGQPPEFASAPTLELHISTLRDLLLTERLTFVEIVPIPAGYRFIVCLTHDVDHPRVRHHRFDHTMFGFLYRALIGSVIQSCNGRRSLAQLAVNWKAAMSLPFVFAGLANDFWNQINEYLKLEKDLASTFFVIPLKGDPGLDREGRARAKRAASYDLADVAGDLEKLHVAKREIAVHGIDAWRDEAKGRVERERIQQVTGTEHVGARMHWLYFDPEAPIALEKAGFAYDSTVGYNETIGYRAGTTQVFKPLNVDRLLELPLHIMDTALFYPSCMNLSDEQASLAMRPLIENASRFGGVLTTNWHDRSLGPERLWNESYRQLLRELKIRQPWFATARDTVSWFQKRRAASIQNVTNDGNAVRAKVCANEDVNSLPALVARVHTPMRPDHQFVDVPIDRSTTIEVSI
jgi:hypothetical protein